MRVRGRSRRSRCHPTPSLDRQELPVGRQPHLDAGRTLTPTLPTARCGIGPLSRYSGGGLGWGFLATRRRLVSERALRGTPTLTLPRSTERGDRSVGCIRAYVRPESDHLVAIDLEDARPDSIVGRRSQGRATLTSSGIATQVRMTTIPPAATPATTTGGAAAWPMSGSSNTRTAMLTGHTAIQ